MDSRRYLSTFAVFALVLLRLVIGWHFFGEGGKKVEYDRHDRSLKLVFSAEDFLANANGPLSKLYRSQIPGVHGYRDLLAVPRQNVPTADADAAPSYQPWLERIEADWQAIRDDVKAVPGLTEEQKTRADEAFAQRLTQATNYLKGEEAAIVEYQHELWRLENWRGAAEAGEVPFHNDRITTKAGETKTAPAAWRNEIDAIEVAYRDDLRGLLTTEQREAAETVTPFNNAMSSSQDDRLRMMNLAVTVLTLGVGICLLLGFFTRLASIVGALFLLFVIASQPPWLSDSLPTMPNCIELAGLLVLAGTGAGRWMGLDYFTWAIFRPRRDAE